MKIQGLNVVQFPDRRNLRTEVLYLSQRNGKRYWSTRDTEVAFNGQFCLQEKPLRDQSKRVELPSLRSLHSRDKVRASARKRPADF